MLGKRFVELRDGADRLVLDCKDPNLPVIVCRCEGFNAPLNAEYVAAALQFYHDHLFEKVLGECGSTDQWAGSTAGTTAKPTK